jgi:LacI family transcriptional regulator
MTPLKSQKEIARKFGVSQMTVSRALNNSSGVSEKLRSKIQQYAEEHGFATNRLASGLGRGSTRIIGLLMPDMSFSYYPEITDGIEETLRAEGYYPVLYLTGEDRQELGQGITLLAGFRTEGLVVAPTAKSGSELFQQLDSLGIPFVFVDRYLPDLESSYVVSDAEQGEIELIDYLVDAGHRRIVLVTGPEGLSFASELKRGYQKAMKKHGLATKMVGGGGLDEEAGLRAGKKILKMSNRPSAVVAVNDPVALGVMQAMQEAKLAIPNEISIAGFSDIKLAAKVRPTLTTVREDARGIGRRAASLLLEMIGSDKKHVEQIKLPVELVVRESTASR